MANESPKLPPDAVWLGVSTAYDSSGLMLYMPKVTGKNGIVAKAKFDVYKVEAGLLLVPQEAT